MAIDGGADPYMAVPVNTPLTAGTVGYLKVIIPPGAMNRVAFKATMA